MSTRLALCALSLALVCGCHFSFYSRPDYEPVGEFEIGMASTGAKKIKLRNNVGTLTVEPGDSQLIWAEVKVHYRGGRKELGRAPTPAQDFILELTGDAVNVRNSHVDESGASDWMMDIHLKAPRGLDLEITGGVGDCHVRDMEASASVKVGVGNTDVTSGRTTGVSVAVGTGDVNLVLYGEGPSGDVRCKSGVGNVSIRVPHGFAGEVILRTGVGNITVENATAIVVDRHLGSASAQGRLGDSAVKIRGGTGTGDVYLTRD